MKSIKVASFLFFVLMCLVNTSTQDSLEGFVRLKMANYSTWLENNNLDPSPIVAGPSFFQAVSNVTSVNVTISNQRVEGHSSTITLDTMYANLPFKLFLVSFNITGNCAFYGDYSGEGRMFDGSTFGGAGMWTVQVRAVYPQVFAIVFEELPTGFLNVTSSALTTIKLEDRDSWEVYFEYLLENEAAVGHEQDIRLALFEGFQQYLNDDHDLSEHPIRAMFLKYWQEILSETTMEDIRNTPPPNSTAVFNA